MTKKIFVLYLTIILVTANKHRKSDDNDDIPVGHMILNGWKAEPTQFPWQVGVMQNGTFCGGALISNQWVLTAGHCTDDMGDFYITLGSTMSYDDEPEKVSMLAVEVHIHPEYNNPAKLNNDIAIIKLPELVTFNENIKSIRLPDYGEKLEDNTDVWVSGWGATSKNVGRVNDLHFVGLTTITNEECKKTYGATYVPDGVFCCKGHEGGSTCSGDSGGPVVQKHNGVWTLVGLMSYSTGYCQNKSPVGFTRTEYYLDFIYEITGLKSS